MGARFYIDENNLATLVCPKCGFDKIIDASKYVDMTKEIKLRIRCRCKNSYIAILERRKSHRKETDLYGTFVSTRIPGTFKVEKDGLFGEVTIVNLSRGGLRFQVSGRNPCAPEDTIQIEFHLDDMNRSRIQKRAVVKSVMESEVGAQFSTVDPTDSSDVAIGFYLLSKS